jgi:hypothetical protein
MAEYSRIYATVGILVGWTRHHDRECVCAQQPNHLNQVFERVWEVEDLASEPCFDVQVRDQPCVTVGFMEEPAACTERTETLSLRDRD